MANIRHHALGERGYVTCLPPPMQVGDVAAAAKAVVVEYQHSTTAVVFHLIHALGERGYAASLNDIDPDPLAR